MTDPEILEAARGRQYDRYLSALLAPEPARSRLLALAAFAAELDRIADSVSEPRLGEIRLQWWRDILAVTVPGTRTGSPIADGLVEATSACDLPRGLLDGLIDAAAARLWSEPVSDEAELSSHLARSDGALFALAARTLGARPASGIDAACRPAGSAYGLVRLGEALAAGDPRAHALAAFADRPDEASRVLAGLAEVSLAAALARLGNLEPALRPAFLPLATLRPRIAALKAGAVPGPGSLQRIWRIWRASRRGF